MNRAEFKIYGLVQGVGFRYFVYQKAKELGLVGYAKNLFDGSVLVIAEGEKGKLDKLYHYLKIGPTYARIDKIEVEYSTSTGMFDGFFIQ
ncbi:MAG: acylphosphatase [Candidatus Kapaibacteriales bacterium]